MNRMNAIGVLAAAATVIVLAGCGTAAPASTAAPSPAPASAATAPTDQNDQNDADVTFVQGMIPHHSQAVDMAELAADRASNKQVKDLATRIQQAQGPEIEQMQGFLAAWGMPESGAGSMDGMNHGGDSDQGMAGMSGMMNDDQMQQLQDAQGAGFDRMFLQMMIEHHTGAVQMAKTELADGQNQDAKDLAQKIIDAQQSEITEMQALEPKV